jgi:hypothetical protein
MEVNFVIYERMRRENGSVQLTSNLYLKILILLFCALNKQNIFSQGYILKSLSDILLIKNSDF